MRLQNTTHTLLNDIHTFIVIQHHTEHTGCLPHWTGAHKSNGVMVLFHAVHFLTVTVHHLSHVILMWALLSVGEKCICISTRQKLNSVRDFGSLKKHKICVCSNMLEKKEKGKKTLERWNWTTVTSITYRSEACTPHQWGSFKQWSKSDNLLFKPIHALHLTKKKGRRRISIFF